MQHNQPKKITPTRKTLPVSSGYIMVTMLLLISLAMIIVTQIYRNGRIQNQFDAIFIQREKAKILALNGLSIAYSQLYVAQDKKNASSQKTTPTTQKQDTTDPNIVFLNNVLPYLNQFRTITLKKDIDGIEGTINVCISCEAGKIPINFIYNFKNKKFISPEIEDFIRILFSNLKPFVNEKNLFDQFTSFLKNQMHALNDPTEIITIKDFEKTLGRNIFYEPPDNNIKRKYPVYLLDIFTAWSNDQSINPWFLSHSLITLLQLRPSHEFSIADRKNIITDILKNFKKSSNVQETWNTLLKKIYGKYFQSLPKGFVKMLRTKVPPQFFSIVSIGTFGDTTQKLYAIIEKHEPKNESEELFSVKHLYWM